MIATINAIITGSKIQINIVYSKSYPYLAADPVVKPKRERRDSEAAVKHITRRVASALS